MRTSGSPKNDGGVSYEDLAMECPCDPALRLRDGSPHGAEDCGAGVIEDSPAGMLRPTDDAARGEIARAIRVFCEEAAE